MGRYADHVSLLRKECEERITFVVHRTHDGGHRRIMTEITVYVDLLCPWAYQAMTWLREVRRHRDLDITWRWFSLEEAKRGDNEKHPWERSWSYGWSLMRVGEYIREVEGEGSLDRFCEVTGQLLHDEGLAVHTPDGARDAMARAGWRAGIVDDALVREETALRVRAMHDAAVSLGVHGVPTIVFESGEGFFGPVVAPAPVGRAALQLWDLVAGWREFPHLYQLSRVQNDGDSQHIARTFDAYRQARGWVVTGRKF